MGVDRDAIAQLEERLRRYPADRYPVQHATARFHLGAALAEAGDLSGAEQALVAAARLFDPQRLGAEHGKAMNALGAVLHQAGRHGEAAAVLGRAAAALEGAGLVAEHGAARFNLGLVLRERGDLPAAAEAFERAHTLFGEARAPGQTAAAARELGAARLAAGDLRAAREVLERAVELAERAGDQAGLGTAANVLGLVHLAAERAPEAVEAFRVALAAHPRGVRPAEHAMAKANAALAHERAGDAVRSRPAAHQALGVPAAPEPVRAQAQGVLDRLGGGPGDVLALLDAEERERWPALVREEVVRWVDADAGERREELGAWIDGQLTRGAAATDLAEAFVASLLELPPDAMEAVARGVVEALGERDPAAQRQFRSQVAMAAARFHVPQLLRVRDTFNRIAVEVGEEPAWT